MNVYLDACILIYLVESHEHFAAKVKQALRTVSITLRVFQEDAS